MLLMDTYGSSRFTDLVTVERWRCFCGSQLVKITPTTCNPRSVVILQSMRIFQGGCRTTTSRVSMAIYFCYEMILKSTNMETRQFNLGNFPANHFGLPGASPAAMLQRVRSGHQRHGLRGEAGEEAHHWISEMATI